jgi:hypothetical protein
MFQFHQGQSPGNFLLGVLRNCEIIGVFVQDIPVLGIHQLAQVLRLPRPGPPEQLQAVLAEGKAEYSKEDRLDEK